MIATFSFDDPSQPTFHFELAEGKIMAWAIRDDSGEPLWPGREALGEVTDHRDDPSEPMPPEAECRLLTFAACSYLKSISDPTPEEIAEAIGDPEVMN